MQIYKIPIFGINTSLSRDISLLGDTSAPTGAWKCNLPPFWKILTDRRTNQQTIQLTKWMDIRVHREATLPINLGGKIKFPKNVILIETYWLKLSSADPVSGLINRHFWLDLNLQAAINFVVLGFYITIKIDLILRNICEHSNIQISLLWIERQTAIQMDSQIDR